MSKYALGFVDHHGLTQVGAGRSRVSRCYGLSRGWFLVCRESASDRLPAS
jgi:hypothetical protein